MSDEIGTAPETVGTAKKMKKYVGKKEVYAEKIKTVIPNGTEANSVLVFEDDTHMDITPEYMEKHKPVAGGYFVMYDGGYQSWSPADVFEAAYKSCDTFRDRLAIENDELVEKVGKLELALEEGMIPDSEVSILNIQLRAMKTYREILTFRIDKLG